MIKNESKESGWASQYVLLYSFVPIIVRVLGGLVFHCLSSHCFEVFPCIVLEVWIILANKVLLIACVHSFLVSTNLRLRQLIQVSSCIVEILCVNVGYWQLLFNLRLRRWRRFAAIFRTLLLLCLLLPSLLTVLGHDCLGTWEGWRCIKWGSRLQLLIVRFSLSCRLRVA